MANTKVTSRVLANDAVLTANIADDQVTTAKIADDVALGGNPTTTTQSAGNNTTRIATTAFVTTAVANIVDSAPSALDTLNELAAALGDDANFSTTITNSIATKAPLAGPTFTGDVDIDATDDLRLRFLNGGTFKAGIQVPTSTGDMISGAAVDDLAIRSQANMLFSTGGNTERLRIDNTGRVGIGMTPSDHSGYMLQMTGGSQSFIAIGNDTTGTGALNGLIVGNDSTGADIYQRENQPLRLHTNNSERMRIDASGNVGIGTTATDPYSLGATGKTLSINSSNASTGALLSLESADTNRGYLFGNSSNVVLSAVPAIPLVFKTTDTERMRIASNGTVGIGDSSPSYLLDVKSTANADTPLFRINNTSSGDSAAARLYMTANGNNFSLYNYGDGTGYANETRFRSSAGGSYFTFAPSSSEKMRITSTGSVGIGTTSPSSLLHVDGSFSGTAVTIHNTAGASSSDRGLDVETSSTGTTVQRWFNSGTELMRVGGNGNVGINTTNSGDKLSVCGTVRFNTTPADGEESRHYFTVGGAADAASYSIYDGGQNVQVFFTGNGASYITGGNLGVGDSSPAYRLELPNTANANGQLRCHAVITYSDERIKSNIQTLDYGLDVVKKLKPSKYKHHKSVKEDGQFVKQDEGSNDIGFIAQEVLPLIPEVVSVPEDEDKDLYSISYPKLTAVLTKAIQEQQEQIETLKKEVEELKGG